LQLVELGLQQRHTALCGLERFFANGLLFIRDAGFIYGCLLLGSVRAGGFKRLLAVRDMQLQCVHVFFHVWRSRKRGQWLRLRLWGWLRLGLRVLCDDKNRRQQQRHNESEPLENVHLQIPCLYSPNSALGSRRSTSASSSVEISSAMVSCIAFSDNCFASS